VGRDVRRGGGEEDDGEHLVVNGVARVALKCLACQTELNHGHATLGAREVQGAGPITGFQDALVFASAAFFEVDRAKNFWHLDEFLAHHFIPCYDALLEALAEDP